MTIFLHYGLVFLMISKLMPDLLDKVDLFVLEVEELFVPKVGSPSFCLSIYPGNVEYNRIITNKNNVLALTYNSINR